MTDREIKTDAPLSLEKRREDAARGWSQYLHLDWLTNAKHKSQGSDGKWREDSYEHGATGDGANLFVLVEDTDGVHALKVGAGEFSPRTFLEDGSYYGLEDMPYATRLKNLTAITPIYVLEQDDGYFNLSPVDNPKEHQEFMKNPANYMSKYARMIAREGGVDFNSAHKWYDIWDEPRTPGYAEQYGGGMVDLNPDELTAISLEDFEAALLRAKTSQVGETAVVSAAH